MFTHPAFWIALICLLLLIANLWYFFTREWESAHSPVSYATLNYPQEAFTVREWKIEAGHRLRPIIICHPRPAQWQLLVDGQPVRVLPGNDPCIDPTGAVFDGANGAVLADFKHRYTLRPLPEGSGPDLEFTLTVIAREFYRQRNMHFPKDVILTKTDAPAGKFTRHPLRYWVDDYRYMGRAALAEADRIVREEMQVLPADDTLTRMDKVIRHMRTKLAAAGGVPKDDYRWMDPLRIYQEMCAGTGKGWCTQNAQIYTFFANRAGVPTRYVFGATVQSNAIVYNGHSWAESWLPGHCRWVYVDPQASIVAVYGRNGKPLSSADLFHLCLHDTLDGVTARIFKDWGWKDLPYEAAPGTAVTVPFSLVSRVAKQEFTEQTILKYRRPPNVEDVRNIYSMLLRNRTFAWVNFKRYLFTPAPAYSLMPTEGPRIYLVRRSLFVALVLGLGLLGFSLG